MQEQLAFKLVEEPKPADIFMAVWKRTPAYQHCTYQWRPAEAPNEKDEERWETWRKYLLLKSDFRRGITDTDVKNIKRLMIEELSAESQGMSSERYWDYDLCFSIKDDCWLVCWLV